MRDRGAPVGGGEDQIQLRRLRANKSTTHKDAARIVDWR